MVLAVFKIRVDPAKAEEFGQLSGVLSEIAQEMPGYISHKGYGAGDGENVVLVEFETEAQMRDFQLEPTHLAAQRRGAEFFESYSIQICEVTRASNFKR